MDHPMPRVLDKDGETDLEIKKRLERKDRNRKTYYKYYTDREWGKYVNYHLNLDSGYLGIDLCVKIIADTVRAKEEENKQQIE